MAAANQGDVELELNGETVSLACTLGAAKQINARFGSFADAARRVALFDFSAYVLIVAAGLNKKEKEVEADVFAAGIKRITKPVNDYIISLSNGGQPDDAKGGDSGEN